MITVITVIALAAGGAASQAAAQNTGGISTPRLKPIADYTAAPGAPYTAEEVTVPTRTGFTLAGTLTLPKGASKAHPAAAIVTITGSGRQDRDEAMSFLEGYRPFRQIADSLGRRGIAVLRMDDREVGGSQGVFKGSTTADFADDIRTALAYLRTRPEIDPSRLGLVGHSEGGLIAPMVAAKEPGLRGIVLLAGPSQRGRQILRYQLENEIDNSKLTGSGRDSARATIGGTIDSLAATDPWMKFFFDYDPIATARAVKTPVLILNGAKDQQVTPDQVPPLEAAFRAAGDTDVTTRIFPNTDHEFMYDTVGDPEGYAKLKLPHEMQPVVVGTVVDWLAKRLD